jgi:hypothetical protein
MSAAPARSFTLLAAAIVVAAIIVSATLFVTLGVAATVTKTSTSTEFGTSTLTSTSTIISTSTVTTTCLEGSVNAVNALGPRAANTFEPLFDSNSTTDCQLGITLGLSANPGIVTGTNESITVSLANDEPESRDVNYTSFPPLQHGLDSSSAAWYDDVLPLQPPCGYPSNSSFEPAFIVVYNATGFPMQLSGSPMPILNCISSGGQYHPFTASQTINESISIGGYWTSPNAEEPWVNASYSQFSPGNYAIVAFDTWGQATELNFTVNPSGTTVTASTSTECTISSEGSGFYVTVLTDAGQPIQGAQVTGTSSPCQQDIGTYVTNSTGSVLITPDIGSYYQLSITYQGNAYAVRAPIEPMTTTYVTLSIPSGNVTISEVFEGGCQTNSQGVSCPG